MCVAVVSEPMRRVQLHRLTFVELLDDDAALTYSLAFALRNGEGLNAWGAVHGDRHGVAAQRSAELSASDRTGGAAAGDAA